MRRIPLLLWATCNCVVSRRVTPTCWSLTRCTENCFCAAVVVCFFISICSVHYRNTILYTRNSRKDIFNNIRCSLNMGSQQSKCLYCRSLTQIMKHRHISYILDHTTDDLKWVSLFPPKQCQQLDLKNKNHPCCILHWTSVRIHYIWLWFA